MDAYRYPNLTIIKEDENIKMKTTLLRHSIIAKFLTHEAASISIHDIQAAIQLQYNTRVYLHDISALGSDFLLNIHPHSLYTTMLATGYITMFPISPTLIPWNPEYGCTKVPARAEPANPFRLNYSAISHDTWEPLRQLLIDIHGIPTHLCIATQQWEHFSRRHVTSNISHLPAQTTYTRSLQKHIALTWYPQWPIWVSKNSKEDSLSYLFGQFASI